jgi:hypothetical protein
MRAIVLAAAGSVMLAWAPSAWAQLDTSAQAYRNMNSPADNSYGSSGGVRTGGGGGSTTADAGWFSGLSIISPNDPTYSYTEPPHAGQSPVWELNGDDGGRGTSYPAIKSNDGGG